MTALAVSVCTRVLRIHSSFCHEAWSKISVFGGTLEDNVIASLRQDAQCVSLWRPLIRW
jgi:hypothetical protein